MTGRRVRAGQRRLGMGTDGLWWAFPMTNVATATSAGIWFLRGDWKTRRLIAHRTAQEEEEVAVAEQVIP